MIVVDQIVEKISEVAAAIAFRHIGYLYHYNENIQDLENETERLKEMLRRIHDMVVRALRNAEDIEPDVEKWQNDAKEMVDEVATFLENKVRSNTRFCKCWCPNPMWRYRLSKESALKRAHVISLKDHGTKFLTVLPLSHPAPPPEPPLKNNEDFDSRKEIFHGIIEVLNDPTIKMIGVHGAGGIGKTKMVKDVLNQAKRDKLFDDVAFAVVSQKMDKEKVQGELAAQLGLTLHDSGRAEKLSTRLQNRKKNLVILDDVWDPINLEEIGIPSPTDNGNKPGCCKVLITSRKNLFHMMTPKPSDQRAPGISKVAPKVFLIPILEKKETWTLFVRTAEISVNDIDEEMLSIATEVCGECAGLPVAILAVATALKGKEKYAWKDALAQLKGSNFEQIVDINQNLFSSLKLSYDLLRLDDERSCFLLCSLFPEDAEITIDDLVRYSFGMRLLGSTMSTKLEDVRNRVLTVVKSLKASCLLLDGKYDVMVKMHDVIRDVAITIAKDEKKHLVKHNLKSWSEGGPYEGYSAISLMSEYFGEIPSELGCKELHTLVLRSKDCSLPDSFFNGMESNLEALDLSGMAIESIPFSLSKLVKLRMLFLPKGVRDISLLGELKSLEILYAKGIYELPLEIRQLTRLKLLDLYNAYKLGLIPPNVLSNLTSMEELCIPDYYGKWQDEATNEERSNASLVELNSLTSLTTLKVHIPEGKSSPNLPCFEKLDRFRISIGAKFNEYYPDVSYTRIVRFYNAPLEDKFIVLMLKSEALDLEKVKGLEKVLHHMDGSGLKYLAVRECDGGEHLLGRPEQFLITPQERMSRSFCNLSKLSVKNCTFKYLFNISVARCLEHLQEISVTDCSNMEVIVGKERQGDDEEITFPRLKDISLTGLPNLKSFCTSKRPDSIKGASSSEPSQSLFCEKVVVPALEDLSIEGLDNISEIWDKQFTPIIKEGTGSFNQLLSLDVRSCPRLVNVVPSNMVKRLRNLKILRLRNCDSLVHEIEDLTVVLPGLETLWLKGLHNLREMGLNEKEDSLRGIDVVHPKMKEIFFRDCPNLESRFSASIAKNRAHLETLTVYNCFTSDSKLTVLVETSEERDGTNDEPFVFPKLFLMVLCDLADLESFCNSFGHEESFFNQKVVFPLLHQLCISSLGRVKGIWDRTPPADSFQQLSKLELSECQSLLYVAPSEVLGALQNLESLYISSCNLLEEVFKSWGSESEEGQVLQHDEPTTRLEVDTDVVVLPRLTDLYLYDLPRLKSFCAGSKLPSSAEIDIQNCPLLETQF